MPSNAIQNSGVNEQILLNSTKVCLFIIMIIWKFYNVLLHQLTVGTTVCLPTQGN